MRIAICFQTWHGEDAQLITEDGQHLALIQQDPALEWAEFIVKAVNNLIREEESQWNS